MTPVWFTKVVFNEGRSDEVTYWVEGETSFGINWALAQYDQYDKEPVTVRTEQRSANSGWKLDALRALSNMGSPSNLPAAQSTEQNR